MNRLTSLLARGARSTAAAWLLSATTTLAIASCGIDSVERPVITAASARLPCNVEAVLAADCQGCHGTSLEGGAPMPLVTYGDLTAKNSSGITRAERSLERMTSTTSPMPPHPAAPVTPDGVAEVQAWITAGMPRDSCTDPVD